jgi:hypothetical protein
MKWRINVAHEVIKVIQVLVVVAKHVEGRWRALRLLSCTTSTTGHDAR